MAYIDWKDEYSVGIPVFDAQHQRLLRMVNELQDALINRQTKETMGRIINQMTTYTVTHFRTEEQYLERYGYPDLAEHRKQHESFIELVSNFRLDWEHDRPVRTREVLSFLKEWWVSHILETDMQYSPFLRDRGAK